MTAPAVSAAPFTPPPAPSAWRLVPLLIRFRFRHLWNGLRSRRRFSGLLIGLLFLAMPAAYMGLLSQALSVIAQAAGPAVERAALSIMAVVIALASLAGKVANTETVMAGSAENEFLLTRPVSMATLVVSRSVAGVATDLFDALFLLPVLLAAAMSWGLGGAGVVVTILVSMAVQVSVASLAQATQIAAVRYLPLRARRIFWMALGLGASLAIAGLWMSGTWILRSPASLAATIAPHVEAIALSPAGWIVAPLAALRDGNAAGVMLALLVLGVAAAGTVAVAWAVARHAGMHGWEEAGAPWAGLRGGRRRPLTIAAKDLKMLVRDRARLVSLVAMPVLFVGVQVFGAAGWSWSTANVDRIAALSYSLCVYMATIGPLPHMQAERRAFWLLRSVPVPLGQLMAAKARFWSLVLGATGALSFAVLVTMGPHRAPRELIEHGVLVVIGAVMLSWLAVALACDGADLSDEQRPAVGPGTVWLFMLVGGLFNVVLAGDAETRVRGLALLTLVTALTWWSGMERAAECLDAEAMRLRRLRPGDGAVMALLLFLGQRGALEVVHRVAGSERRPEIPMVAFAVPMVVLGVAAAVYLVRRPRARRGVRLLPGLLCGVGAGALGGGALLAAGAARWPAAQLVAAAAEENGPGVRLGAAGAFAVLALAEELVYRGVIQGSLEQRFEGRRGGRALAAGISASIAILASVFTAALLPLPGALIIGVLPAAARALTGHTAAAWLARAGALATLLLAA